MERKVCLKNTSGEPSTFIFLDLDKSLKDIREELVTTNKMQNDDLFFYQGAIIDPTIEKKVSLKEIVVLQDANLDISQQTYELCIGLKPPVEISNDYNEYIKWEDLTTGQQKRVIQNAFALRGIILSSEKDIERSFKDLVTLKNVPERKDTGANTSEESHYAFSKITQKLKLNFSQNVSLDLNIPFFNINAEYKYQKEQQQNSTQITEYLLQKLIIKKATLKLDIAKDIIVNPEFVESVASCLEEKSDSKKLENLLSVLEEWGYYLPVIFTLGGMLYSEESTIVTDLEQADDEQNKFSLAASNKYTSFGYSGNIYTEKSSQQENKYKDCKILQIGGTEGSAASKDIFASALANPMQWKIVEIEETIPTLQLLNNHGQSGIRQDLISECITLLNNTYNLPIALSMQPYINLHAYATRIEENLFTW